MPVNPFPFVSTARRRLAALAGAAALGLLAAGCSSGPALLTAGVTADGQVNPDARKRPSPVMVRVYELKAPTAFDSADFVSLFEKDQATLGADMLSREEFVLRPGEGKAINKVLSPDTKFIGVMAAFREIERSRWHVVLPVAGGKTNVMSFTLTDTTVEAKRHSP